jgi:soluble lytic murein transglycosylase-like protein
MAYRFRGMGAASPSPAVSQALQSAATAYGVPYSLLASTAKAESGFNPSVTSSAGAEGLMQIMPSNFATLGVSNPFDPQQSANAGAKYLAQLYAQYGDWETALIAYNEGPGALASHGVYPSSQAYASGILADAGIMSSPDTSGSPAPSPAWYDILAPAASDGSPVDTSAGMSPWVLAGLAAAAIGIVWAVAG